MLHWQRQWRSGRCEQTLMRARRHSSCWLQTGILKRKRMEPEQNFHNSQMLNGILWVVVDDSVNPNMEQNRISSCLKFLIHSWSHVLCVCGGCKTMLFFSLQFPTSDNKVKQWQLDMGLPFKQGAKIASPFTVLGLWLLVPSLASYYKGNPEKQCQKATTCFDQSKMVEILYQVHTPPRTNCQFTMTHNRGQWNTKCIRFGSHVKACWSCRTPVANPQGKQRQKKSLLKKPAEQLRLLIRIRVTLQASEIKQ